MPLSVRERKRERKRGKNVRSEISEYIDLGTGTTSSGRSALFTGIAYRFERLSSVCVCVCVVTASCCMFEHAAVGLWQSVVGLIEARAREREGEREGETLVFGDSYDEGTVDQMQAGY